MRPKGSHRLRKRQRLGCSSPADGCCDRALRDRRATVGRALSRRPPCWLLNPCAGWGCQGGAPRWTNDLDSPQPAQIVGCRGGRRCRAPSRVDGACASGDRGSGDEPRRRSRVGAPPSWSTWNRVARAAGADGRAEGRRPSKKRRPRRRGAPPRPCIKPDSAAPCHARRKVDNVQAAAIASPVKGVRPAAAGCCARPLWRPP